MTLSPMLLQRVRHHPFLIAISFLFLLALLSLLSKSRIYPSSRPRRHPNGYFFRDWSLGLGFNNYRYNLEASLLQASILGRTLVIPSFVYARKCQVELATCALFFELVDRRRELHDDQWNDQDAPGFRVPIEHMVNLSRISAEYSTPVITLREFAKLHSLPSSIEQSDGQSILRQHDTFPSDKAIRPLTVKRIANEEYDTVPFLPTDRRIVRIDQLEGSYRKLGLDRIRSWDPKEHDMRHVLNELKAVDGHVSLSDAEGVLGRKIAEGLAEELDSIGYGLAYTFHSFDDLDSAKSPTWDEEQVVDLLEARGWWDDYSSVEEDILYLPGEIHDGRRPGFMRFSTPEARTAYSDLPTKFLRPKDWILSLADELASQLEQRCHGRGYLAAHIRRGDFVGRLVWSPDDFATHLARTKEQLAEGRRRLWTLAERNGHPTAHVSQDDDPFFVATDETDPIHLDMLRASGAILVSDLLTLEQRRQYSAYPLLLQDISSELEQAVMARSSFFVGTLRSSVPGWVLNQRAGLGYTREESLLYKISY